jgi:nucleotide-binding universal stress UspA family protein
MACKRILIAIDGSDASEKALNYAIDLAKNEGSALSILAVAELLYSCLPTMQSKKGINEPYLSIIKESCNILDEAVKKVYGKAPTILVDRILVVGDPVKEITKIGNSGTYDLIITGHRKLGNGSPSVLGSFNKKIPEIASCPV